jgi:hypothetical protein
VNRYRRITRREAYQRFEDNLPFLLVGNRLQPQPGPMGMHSSIHPATYKVDGHTRTFEEVLEDWAFFNASIEAGMGPHFYVDTEADTPGGTTPPRQAYN